MFFRGNFCRLLDWVGDVCFVRGDVNIYRVRLCEFVYLKRFCIIVCYVLFVNI